MSVATVTAALQATLHACNDAASWLSAEPLNGFLGVDMGTVNIATTSTGAKASGARLNSYRKRQLRFRKRLQAKKTRSARRLLKKRRRDHNAAIDIAFGGVDRWGEVMRPHAAPTLTAS